MSAATLQDESIGQLAAPSQTAASTQRSTSGAAPAVRGAIGEPITLEVGSLDLEANGVAHHEGKVVFVRGALPGEQVRASVVRRKPRFEVAQATEVIE